MKLKKVIEMILTAILSSASFVQMIRSQVIDTFFGKWYVILFLTICASLLGVMLILDLYKIYHTVHCFKKGSSKFCDFFAKWYSKPGVLTLICDDLNWTAEKIKGRAPILEALEKKAKANQLVVYLKSNGGTDQAILDKLSTATIKPAQDNIVNKYSFSCLNYMGNNSAVIVRDKNKDSGDEVIFQEVADTYVTQLLNALLEA